MNREELARLLRRSREGIDPVDVGLPVGQRRRVTGLRREEVASLAGISVDYVVRLEQARGPRPTPAVLSALARALRMSDAQRDRLFEFANAKPPHATRIELVVRPSVHRLLERLAELPVLVVSAKGDALAWTALAAALLGDFAEVSGFERNTNWQRFLGTRNRVSEVPEEREHSHRQAVARLVAASARYPDDPDLQQLVSELRSRSERFERLWQQSPTEVDVAHPKTILHPDFGPTVFDCDTLVLPESGQTVLVYSAQPGTVAHARLQQLRVPV